MTETAAMLVEIVERYPESELAPPAGSGERARFLRWLFFLASNVYPAVLRAYYPERYSTDSGAAEGIKAAAKADLDDPFRILDDALDPGPYLIGGTFSAVDILRWMLMQWHPAPSRLSETVPRIERLAGRVQARPAIARTWREHEEN